MNQWPFILVWGSLCALHRLPFSFELALRELPRQLQVLTAGSARCVEINEQSSVEQSESSNQVFADEVKKKLAILLKAKPTPATEPNPLTGARA